MAVQCCKKQLSVVGAVVTAGGVFLWPFSVE